MILTLSYYYENSTAQTASVSKYYSIIIITKQPPKAKLQRLFTKIIICYFRDFINDIRKIDSEKIAKIREDFKKLVLVFNQLKHFRLIDDVEVAMKGIR